MIPAPIAICMFEPEALAKTPQRGTMFSFEWDRLGRWCSSPAVVADKASEGGFTLADLREGIRRNSHVSSVSALGLDHDAGMVTLGAVDRALSRFARILYTTASHTPQAPRWRAIVALSRPATHDEYREVWRHAAQHLVVGADVALDKAKDSCRLWYSPTVKTLDSAFAYSLGGGVALNVDKVIVVARARKDRERHRPAELPKPEHRDRYIAAALGKAAAAVAAASHGDRHAALRDQAYSLARLGLTEGDIAGALMPAFIVAAGHARESEGSRTVRDAVRARNMRP